MDNFVSIDWRNGPDRIFFFFKGTDMFASFSLGDSRLEKHHPILIKGHWGDFEQHVDDLRFGFTVPSPDWHSAGGGDMVWFFYYDGETPMACKFSQITSSVVFKKKLSDTDWWPLGNFFHKIVGVMLDEKADVKHTYWVLLNDGRYFKYNPGIPRKVKVLSMANSEWSFLEKYKDRIVTTALNNYPVFDTYFYIFLTDEEYLRFDLKTRKASGPHPIDEETWPGLFD